MIGELAASQGQYLVAGAGVQELFSAELLAGFTPSGLHPDRGGVVLPLVERLSAGGAEGVLFLGHGALALAGAAVLARRRAALPWPLAGGVLTVLAAGPGPPRALLHSASAPIRGRSASPPGTFSSRGRRRVERQSLMGALRRSAERVDTVRLMF